MGSRKILTSSSGSRLPLIKVITRLRNKLSKTRVISLTCSIQKFRMILRRLAFGVRSTSGCGRKQRTAAISIKRFAAMSVDSTCAMITTTESTTLFFLTKGRLVQRTWRSRSPTLSKHAA